MVVSYNASEQILSIILRYVPNDQVDILIEELESVSGNKSYHDSLARIKKSLKEQSHEPTS